MAVIIQKRWYLSRLAAIIHVMKRIIQHSMIISQQAHIPQPCFECKKIKKIFLQNRSILSDHFYILSGPINHIERAKNSNAQSILRDPFQNPPHKGNEVLRLLSELIAQLAFGERILDEAGLAAHLSKKPSSRELWWMRHECATHSRRLLKLQRGYLNTAFAETDGIKNDT